MPPFSFLHEKINLGPIFFFSFLFFFFRCTGPRNLLCFPRAHTRPCYFGSDKQPLALFRLALDFNSHKILGCILQEKKVRVRIE